MKESRIYAIDTADIVSVRNDFTVRVSGLSLIPDGLSTTKVVLTSVEPNGEFPLHKDEYHHVFYFLSGSGEVYVNGVAHTVHPGNVVEIPAGTPHGYKNNSATEMKLLTINIPVS